MDEALSLLKVKAKENSTKLPERNCLSSRSSIAHRLVWAKSNNSDIYTKAISLFEYLNEY